MESPPSEDVAAEFFVLKQGEIFGPVSRAALRQAVDVGEFSREDMVQAAESSHWHSLASVLDGGIREPRQVNAPDWRTLGIWVMRRLSFGIGAGSMWTGLVCLGIGTLVLVLSRWPAVLWLPWFGLTAAAGVIALQKRQTVAGLVQLCTAACVPAVLSFLGLAFQLKPVETVEESPAPPQAEVAAVPARPAATPEPAAGAGTPTVLPELPPPVASAPQKVERLPSAMAPAGGAAGTIPPIPALSSVRAPAAAADGSVAPAEPMTGAEFVQVFHQSIVIVQNEDGAGSGFVCKIGDKTWVLTNIHVLAGMRGAHFTRVDGTRLSMGAAEAAVGHDVMRVWSTDVTALPLEAMLRLEKNVKIGDQIVVLGNTAGGGVVTSLPGELVGIGPDRIEVSAPFVPGNSGSPIIHVKSGKVIGIATYLTQRYEEFAGGRGDRVVRRFGYRLDGISRWEPVNWNIFYNEADQLKRIGELTSDISNFFDALRERRTPVFATSALRRPASEWMTTMKRTKISLADRERATGSFLGALRTLARGDVTTAQGQFRYNFFRDRLAEERDIRDRLYAAFDEQAKNLASPSMRPGF